MNLINAKLIINEVNLYYLDESIPGAIATGAFKTAGLVGAGIKHSAIGARNIINKIKYKRCLKIVDPIQRKLCFERHQ